MYEIYYKESEYLRVRKAKLETLQDVEDYMRDRIGWENYQCKTPKGKIVEVRTMGLNPF